MAASLFGTGGVTNANVQGSLVPQVFTATAGQTLFTLTAFTYSVGTGSLLVFINGSLQSSKDYAETSTGSFTLVEACLGGESVLALGFPETTLDYNGVFATLASPAAGEGVRLVGHSWANAPSDGKLDKALFTAGNLASILREIPVVQWAAIADGSSTYDATTAIQGVLTSNSAWVPEGTFRTSAKLTSDRGVRGASARLSHIKPLSNTFDALELNSSSGEFQQVADLQIEFPSLGTGNGLTLANDNNNVEVNRVEVKYAAKAFNAANIAFMQRYQQCRADFSTLGFYAKGTSSGGTGAGTTLIYDQCYISNGTVTGWDLVTLRGVLMLQPTADMGGCTNVIKTLGVGQLTIVDHHFEGTPGANGAFITYNTQGSLSQGITVIGGCLEANDLSALTYSYLNINANDDSVKVTLMNVNARNLTGGANAKLAKLTGAAGSRIDIIAINCDFGALEGLFDTSGLSGTYTYRRIDQEKAVLAAGQASVASNSTIDTGLTNLDGKNVMVQHRRDDEALPTVMAHVCATYTLNGLIRVRFTKLSDGTEDTGTYNVQWQVAA